MWGSAKHTAAKFGGKALGAVETGKGAIKMAGNAVKKLWARQKIGSNTQEN